MYAHMAAVSPLWPNQPMISTKHFLEREAALKPLIYNHLELFFLCTVNNVFQKSSRGRITVFKSGAKLRADLLLF